MGGWELDAITKEVSWTEETYHIHEVPLSYKPPLDEAINFYHPDDRPRLTDAIEQALEYGEPFDMVIRFITAKGRHLWTHTICDPVVENGKIVKLQGTFQDITERRRAELKLNELRNYLANIIDLMPSILVGVDCGGAVTQWNREAEQATGISAAEAMGKHLAQVFPRLGSQMEPVYQAMQTGVGYSNPRQKHKKDSQTCYEDMTVYPLVTGGVAGAVIRLDNVTEKVRTEEMIVQNEKMASMGGLAAGTAHEINNPLAGMLQAVQNIERRISPEFIANQEIAEQCGTNLDAIRNYLKQRKVLEFLKGIQKCGSRAAEIVRNMLQFSRRSDGQVSDSDIVDLINNSVELAGQDYDLKEKYDFRHIEIIREFDAVLPQVTLVATEIEQVLLNLLKNGAQTMQDNPLEKPPQFILRSMVDGPMIRIEVEDNGPGMTEEVRRRVFEPFFTTKEVGTGTGLGLSVSYMIVAQNHSGEMSVESIPGEGTKFVIKLPLERKQS